MFLTLSFLLFSVAGWPGSPVSVLFTGRWRSLCWWPVFTFCARTCSWSAIPSASTSWRRRQKIRRECQALTWAMVISQTLCPFPRQPAPWFLLPYWKMSIHLRLSFEPQHSLCSCLLPLGPLEHLQYLKVISWIWYLAVFMEPSVWPWGFSSWSITVQSETTCGIAGGPVAHPKGTPILCKLTCAQRSTSMATPKFTLLVCRNPRVPTSQLCSITQQRATANSLTCKQFRTTLTACRPWRRAVQKCTVISCLMMTLTFTSTTREPSDPTCTFIDVWKAELSHVTSAGTGLQGKESTPITSPRALTAASTAPTQTVPTAHTRASRVTGGPAAHRATHTPPSTSPRAATPVLWYTAVGKCPTVTLCTTPRTSRCTHGHSHCHLTHPTTTGFSRETCTKPWYTAQIVQEISKLALGKMKLLCSSWAILMWFLP